jgi:hypothetical protein
MLDDVPASPRCLIVDARSRTPLRRFIRGWWDTEWERLRFRHRVSIVGAFLSAMLVTSPLLFLAANGLAKAFGLDPCQPVKDQPFGWTWFACFMVVTIVFITVAGLLGRALVAYRAHRRGDLNREEAISLVLFGQYPEQWLTESVRPSR